MNIEFETPHLVLCIRNYYGTMEDGREYIIRTWDIHDDDDNVYVDYTLFTEDTDFDTTIEL